MSTFSSELISTPEAVRAAQRDVENLYLGGTALYSKEAIQRMVTRLARYLADQPLDTILVPDMRGIETQVPVFPFYVCQTRPGHWYRGEAVITFHPIQELLDSSRPGRTDVQSVYRPISVGYPDCKPCNEWGEPREYETLPAHLLEPVFDAHRGLWEESVEFGVFRDIVRSQPALARVNKIVAFACGRLTAMSAAIDPEHVVQHAMVFSLRDAVAEMKEELPASDAAANEGVRIILQEPGYTDEDKLVLEMAGAAVVESPEAFLEVDEDTLVVSISPNIPVKQIIADIARPAGMIYFNDQNEWVTRPDGGMPSLCTDPWSPRVESMVERYTATELPYPRRTREIVLYARQPAEADAAGGRSGEQT